MIRIERFSKRAAHALETALHRAEELGHSYIGSEHLLLGLIGETEGVAGRLLLSRGLTPERLTAALRRQIGAGSPTLLSINDMTPRLEGILTRAGLIARRHHLMVVGTDHLLAALCEETRAGGFRLLADCGIDPQKLLRLLRERMEQAELPKEGEKKQSKPTAKPLKFAIHLTAPTALEQSDPLIGREQELQGLMSVLMRKNKNNPCLIGPPGVGKTVIVEGLARKILLGQVPPPLRQTRIYMLDLTAMIAGTKYRGEFEERLRALLEEAERDPQIVLFIDEMHILVGAGAAEGAIDAANILKPALARGRVKVIGATTAEEYRTHIEKDGALERRFAPIWVCEPDRAQTLEILQGLAPSLEAHHRIHLPRETLEAAIDLSVRYMGDRFLPDKAIDLLDEAGGRARLRAFCGGALDREGQIRQKQSELEEALKAREFERALSARETIEQLRILSPADPPPALLSPADLASLIADKTGIPLQAEDPEGLKRFAGLEERLSARIIGQAPAVHSLSSALLRGRAGLKDPKRPACAMLFCGPSGVGKTRLARLLAEELFGSEEALLKYDMGEYREPHSVARLIGAPPGYIGFDQGGGLVARLRERPYAIVLFDEIEKAHPDVLNLLLAVLDEGRLTDGQGKTADFRNATLILTSNLGADAFGDPLGFGQVTKESAQKAARSAVDRAFRPEFINRLDEIIPFAPLDLAAAKEIARLQLEELADRLKAGGRRIEFAPCVAAAVAERSFNRKYGARAIGRFIRREIGDWLIGRMLRGELPEGALTAEMLFGPALTFAAK